MFMGIEALEIFLVVMKLLCEILLDNEGVLCH